jgi:hypothetical protein
MNLQELPVPRKLDSLGLSHSRLNERYHSMEKVNASHSDVSMLLNAVSNKEYMTKAEALLEEQLESVSQRGESNHRKYSLLDSNRYAPFRVRYNVTYCKVRQGSGSSL